jgi:putative flippase GtrA
VKRFARFVFAGGVGFVADAAALALLLGVTPLGPFIARILSILFALTVTWILNRYLTFAPSGRGLVREGARYGGVGLSTSVVNFLVYSALLFLVPSLPPLAALVVASLVAMVLSFVGYSRFVFDR